MRTREKVRLTVCTLALAGSIVGARVSAAPIPGSDTPLGSPHVPALSRGANEFNCMQGFYADVGYADVPYLPDLATRGRHDPCIGA